MKHVGHPSLITYKDIDWNFNALNYLGQPLLSGHKQLSQSFKAFYDVG